MDVESRVVTVQFFYMHVILSSACADSASSRLTQIWILVYLFQNAYGYELWDYFEINFSVLFVKSESHETMLFLQNNNRVL